MTRPLTRPTITRKNVEQTMRDHPDLIIAEQVAEVLCGRPGEPRHVRRVRELMATIARKKETHA